jgi:hypothetical protein
MKHQLLEAEAVSVDPWKSNGNTSRPPDDEVLSDWAR